MENKYKDPESKNRMKQIKLDATKQIERNKVILKDLINKYPPPQTGPSSDAPAAARSRRTANS